MDEGETNLKNEIYMKEEKKFLPTGEGKGGKRRSYKTSSRT